MPTDACQCAGRRRPGCPPPRRRKAPAGGSRLHGQRAILISRDLCVHPLMRSAAEERRQDRRVTMEQLVGDGKISYIGSSNFVGWGVALAQSAATAGHFMGPTSEQILFNLAVRAVELELVPALRHLGIGLIPSTAQPCRLHHSHRSDDRRTTTIQPRRTVRAPGRRVHRTPQPHLSGARGSPAGVCMPGEAAPGRPTARAALLSRRRVLPGGDPPMAPIAGTPAPNTALTSGTSSQADEPGSPRSRSD